MLLDKSCGAFPSGASRLEVTGGDEVCTESPAAASGALVTGNRAAWAREASMTWEDFLREARGGNEASKVQKATSASGEVAQQNCADVTEMDDFLKVLGRCLSAVFVAAQVLGDSHTRPLVHLLQFPSANLVLPAFSQVTVLKLQDLVKRAGTEGNSVSARRSEHSMMQALKPHLLRTVLSFSNDG